MNYIQEGESCHYQGFASCGCAPHLTCNHYEEEDELTDEPIGKRLVAYKPGESYTRVCYIIAFIIVFVCIVLYIVLQHLFQY